MQTVKTFSSALIRKEINALSAIYVENGTAGNAKNRIKGILAKIGRITGLLMRKP